LGAEIQPISASLTGILPPSLNACAWQYYVFEMVTPQVQIPPEILKFQGDTISAQASALCQVVPIPSMPLRIRGEREERIL